MIWNKNKTIYIYEGDTGLLTLGISGEIQEDDILEFRIKENIDDENCIFIQKDEDISDRKFILNIEKETSKKLKANDENDRTYYYGIKLYRNGEVIDTLMPMQKFIVKKVI